MSNEVSGRNYNLTVEFLCECSENAKEGFKLLLRELFPYSLAREQQFLKCIFVVSDGLIPEAVRTLCEATNTPGEYMLGDTLPAGVAIPVEEDGMLEAYIVLESNLIQQITNMEQYHPFELVSVLVEELLHVRLYGLRWLKMGFVRYKSLPPCKEDLYTICSLFHDEFAVSALKTKILGSQNLIDSDEGPVPGMIIRGAPIAPDLNDAYRELARCVIGGASNSLTISEAYQGVLKESYRGIFEPLARDAGFRLGNPTAPHPNSNALESRFYREHVRMFWMQIEAILAKSLINEFSEVATIVSELVVIVDQFWQYIQVQMKPLDDGQCWVHFNSSFFDLDMARNKSIWTTPDKIE